MPRDRATLSLTFDHRIVEGAPAARFLNEVRLQIEAADGSYGALPRTDVK